VRQEGNRRTVKVGQKHECIVVKARLKRFRIFKSVLRDISLTVRRRNRVLIHFSYLTAQ
jgi:hypothetical protein